MKIRLRCGTFNKCRCETTLFCAIQRTNVSCETVHDSVLQRMLGQSKTEGDQVVCNIFVCLQFIQIKGNGSEEEYGVKDNNLQIIRLVSTLFLATTWEIEALNRLKKLFLFLEFMRHGEETHTSEQWMRTK